MTSPRVSFDQSVVAGSEEIAALEHKYDDVTEGLV